MSNDANLTLTLDDRDEALLLFGSRDQYLRLVRDALAVRIIARGDTLQIEGAEEKVALAERVFVQLRLLVRQHKKLTGDEVRGVLEVVMHGGELNGPQTLTTYGETSRHVRPRTDGQARYVKAMRENDLTLCIGPAGTGKTYLAVGMAVSMLRASTVKRIVLVRPAVEAGERLGFLPGDMVAKINPYLRPLLDSLHDMCEPEQVKRYMDNDIIEIVPLAFMRGRAQPLTSQALTPFGFVPIGSLRVGDEVIGSDGKPTPVLGVYPQGSREVFRVVCTDGSTTRCCAEHLWTVWTCDDRTHNRGSRVVKTADMIGRLRSHHRHRFELPLLSAPTEFPWQDVPMEPYALGLLLGDGCLTGSTTPAFATADPEVATALEDALEGVTVRHRDGIDYALNKSGRSRGSAPNPVTVSLRRLGLWGTRSSTKFVPPCYLANTADVRLAVLQGLLDTDGGAVLQAARTCRIQYVTTSPQLCKDVLFLVRSLGGMARYRVRAAAGRKPGRANGRDVPSRSDAYIMEIRLPVGMAPFRLKRKARLYDEAGQGRPMHFVSSIEPDGVEETVCIQVGAADSLYVTDDFILTHNTLNAAVIILDEGQNTTVPQMKMFLTRMGHGSKIIVTGDTTQTDLPKQTKSGLADAVQRLRDIERVSIVYLEKSDIVRHPLVQQIVRAYEDEKPRKTKE